MTSAEVGRIIGKAMLPVVAIALGWYWYDNYKKKKGEERKNDT